MSIRITKPPKDMIANCIFFDMVKNVMWITNCKPDYNSYNKFRMWFILNNNQNAHTLMIQIERVLRPVATMKFETIQDALELKEIIDVVECMIAEHY